MKMIVRPGGGAKAGRRDAASTGQPSIITMHEGGYVWQIPFFFFIYSIKL
jgi:hypothetical protein